MLLVLFELEERVADVCYAAGGGAGMMEALVCHPLGMSMYSDIRTYLHKCSPVLQTPSKSECNCQDERALRVYDSPRIQVSYFCSHSA
jgi:hypothetical protein